MDGQIVCTNAILEQFLQAYVDYQQLDWASLLPFMEYSYNNSV